MPTSAKDRRLRESSLAIAVLATLACSRATPATPASTADTRVQLSVKEVLDGLKPELEKCRSKSRGDVSGCVMLHASLDGSGHVTSITPSATTLPQDLVACATRILKRSEFGAPPEEPDFVVPVSYSSKRAKWAPTCSGPAIPAESSRFGREALRAAGQSSSREEADQHLREALVHYENARRGWLRRLDSKADAETRYAYAETMHFLVMTKFLLDQEPTSAELAEATRSSTELRDGTDLARRSASALMLVSLAEHQLQYAFRLYASSNGAQGLAPPGTSPPPSPLPLPPEAQATVERRAGFLEIVETGDPLYHLRPSVALEAAKRLVAYGQFEQAASWLDQAQRDACALQSPDVSRIHSLKEEVKILSGAARADDVPTPECPTAAQR